MSISDENRLALGLRRILDAAISAESHVSGLTKAGFLEDRKTQDAVCMNIIVIGENAAKLLEQFGSDLETKFADIPWKAMRGMRHRMAHGYELTDYELVWDTIKNYLPDLIAKLEARGY
ncbi:MAG: DUF86 domain-containing protein [Propionivibrio sp.]